mmetsp:Transcript_52596/g.113740  ORF Transcript_52596/g.113740 Transcript_52596/m.113740 type:complete len:106 (-) Transcript_52596:2-319(-)
MAARTRSGLLAVALLAAACCLATRCFVPAPEASKQDMLRGSVGGAVAAAAASSLPALAGAEDAVIPYNYAGEWTADFAVGYFAVTTAWTAFAFFSYLILTKLKII